jgi:hypothetical protein
MSRDGEGPIARIRRVLGRRGARPPVDAELDNRERSLVEHKADVARIPASAARQLTYAALRDVTATHRAAPPDEQEAAALRRLPLTAWERPVFSQFGEDGVIAELGRRIGVASGSFVEFGVESGLEANSVFLANVMGWTGVMLEADFEAARALRWRYAANDRVRTAHSFVLPDTVEEVFANNEVPAEPDLLSIDIDGVDWWIWRAIRSYQPRIVVVEYNGHLLPEQSLTVPESHRAPWDGTAYYGASLTALERLGRTKGYRLVHTELNGNNAFFVRDDLCAAMPDGDVVARRMTNLFLTGTVHPPDSAGREWVEIDAAGEPVGHS